MLVFTPTFTYFGQLITGSGSEWSLSAVEQIGGGELELLEAAAAGDLAHSAVFFAISLTEKVRPNGLREIDGCTKLHI